MSLQLFSFILLLSLLFVQGFVVIVPSSSSSVVVRQNRIERTTARQTRSRYQFLLLAKASKASSSKNKDKKESKSSSKSTEKSSSKSTEDDESSNSSPSPAATSTTISSKDIIKNAEEKMLKSIESMKVNLSSIRTGRASTNLLDRVRVEYFGVLTPLNQVASISVSQSQQLTVEPFDKKSLSLNTLERAIIDSDIGLTPSSSDGTCIRINIPPLTEDRRKDMLKTCKSIGEDGKVAIRNIRRDGVDTLKKLEKAKTISEDENEISAEAIQKKTDAKIKEIDTIIATKEKEIMTV